MSITKVAAIRYRIIDRCLKDNSQRWNWKDLAEECASEIEEITGHSRKSFSERTIKDDLKQMRSNPGLGYYAPIEYDRSEHTYKYTEKGYSITESPLNAEDIDQLRQVVGIIKQFSGFRYLKSIDTIIHKLSLIVYESRKKLKSVLQLEQSTAVPGTEMLERLYESIDNEKAIQILYQKFEQAPYSTVVSPYLLKEYQNRWYLMAYNHQKKAIRTYGLERIQDLKETFQTYITSTNFDPKEYFRDVIGVTKSFEDPVREIHFKIYGIHIHYVRSRPFHHSQREIETADDYAIFSVELRPNREFEFLVLSYGDFLEILKPKTFRKRIAERIEKTYKLYSK
ncbi:MAG: WYL domain-containing protein [Saprospiraceae bacterium]|nr:WYL domain-containing protein [Saprospiraceae bacterium]|tara:strand:+ start:807 stop:1823 length:1017 start_codon:yes stop_codon:yes gene_type:complete